MNAGGSRGGVSRGTVSSGVARAAMSRGAVEIAVLSCGSIAADSALLSDLEREQLATICGDRRRDEWIRGRLAIRRVLRDPATSIVIDADGAPRAVGGRPSSVSLSHDGEWIAVAVADADARVGIDLCVREHASRVKGILAWLGVETSCDPVVAWAALEVGLKLRRWSVESLRDRALSVEELAIDRVVVRGLDASIEVMVRLEPDYVVAWATGVVA